MLEYRGTFSIVDALSQGNKDPAIPMYHFGVLESLDEMHMQLLQMLGLCNPCTRLLTHLACCLIPSHSHQKSGLQQDTPLDLRLDLHPVLLVHLVQPGLLVKVNVTAFG